MLWFVIGMCDSTAHRFAVDFPSAPPGIPGPIEVMMNRCLQQKYTDGV